MKNRFIRVTIVTCIVYGFYVFFFTENIEDISFENVNLIQINSVDVSKISKINEKDTLNFIQKK